LDVKKTGMPEEYKVVLTPSCDMARAKSGQMVLVAQCHAANSFSEDAKLKKGETISDKSARDKKEKLIRSLNTGYNYAKVALPMLPNKMPYMTINLKDIAQIPIEEIGLFEDDIQDKKYYRVASMVSPYREQIVWAHMINSCRPGMPDRNIEEWAEGIMLQ
jgi:CTP synthase